MSKRANGEGTISKHPKGWCGAISLGYDEITGKLKRRYVYGKTQKEVLQKLGEAKSEILNDNYVDNNNIMVSSWLDIWERDFCNHLKPYTRRSYKYTINNHLKNGFNRVKLQDLKPHQVQRFINSLELSPKTVKNIYGVLNKSLNKALELRYIKNNPCNHITLPKLVKPEIRVFSDEELRQIFDALKNHRYYNVYKFALLTGLRRAEILGLTWNCVDFEKGIIRVYRQLQIVNNEYIFSTPKSNKPRNVTLPYKAIEILKELENVRHEDVGNEFIFTNEIGEHLTYNSLAREFRKIIKLLGMPNGTLHDLRHTYAVTCLRAGDNIKALQENLGHATPSFTLERYATVTREMIEETQRKLDSHFSNLDI